MTKYEVGDTIFFDNTSCGFEGIIESEKTNWFNIKVTKEIYNMEWARQRNNRFELGKENPGIKYKVITNYPLKEKITSKNKKEMEFTISRNQNAI